MGLACAAALAILAGLTIRPINGEASPALVESVFVHVPPFVAPGARLRVVVAVHGVGGNGQPFGEQMVEAANKNGWIIVAPTLRYGDWWKVDQLVREDAAFGRWLIDYLVTLPRERAVLTEDRVMLFGFSRGGSVVERFALHHPERVLASAVYSSSSYTLPAAKDDKGRALVYPFGVADTAAYGLGVFNAQAFRSTRWLVGVGASDNQIKDVPQVWSPFIGTTRVDRARNFSTALRVAGAEVKFRTFADTAHTLTTEMRSEALTFLREADPSRGRVLQAPAAPPTPTPTATSAPKTNPIPVASGNATSRSNQGTTIVRGSPTATPTAIPTPTPRVVSEPVAPPPAPVPAVVAEPAPVTHAPVANEPVQPRPSNPPVEPVAPPRPHVGSEPTPVTHAPGTAPAPQEPEPGRVSPTPETPALTVPGEPDPESAPAPVNEPPLTPAETPAQ
jgi:predicted esterase